MAASLDMRRWQKLPPPGTDDRAETRRPSAPFRKFVKPEMTHGRLHIGLYRRKLGAIQGDADKPCRSTAIVSEKYLYRFIAFAAC